MPDMIISKSALRRISFLKTDSAGNCPEQWLMRIIMYIRDSVKLIMNQNWASGSMDYELDAVNVLGTIKTIYQNRYIR